MPAAAPTRERTKANLIDARKCPIWLRADMKHASANKRVALAGISHSTTNQGRHNPPDPSLWTAIPCL